MTELGELVDIRTGKLDANAASENGSYPFFTCAIKSIPEEPGVLYVGSSIFLSNFLTNILTIVIIGQND